MKAMLQTRCGCWKIVAVSNFHPTIQIALSPTMAQQRSNFLDQDVAILSRISPQIRSFRLLETHNAGLATYVEDETTQG